MTSMLTQWMVLLLLAGASCQPCTVDLTATSRWSVCKKLTTNEACMTANTMPSTIMRVMIANNRFPNVTVDNYYSADNMKVIPDMSDVGRGYYTYFYKTVLSPQDSCVAQSRRSFLVLKGVNYRAVVYANGKIVGEKCGDSSQSADGMFKERTYELTAALAAASGQLELAIQVSPVDYPGVPNGDQGGDHEIARNGAVMQYTTGWDWSQGVPDRNTGIFDSVLLQGSQGLVRVGSPYLRLESLSLASIDSATATLHVSLDVSLDTVVDAEKSVVTGTAYIIISEAPLGGASSGIIGSGAALFSAIEVELVSGVQPSVIKLPAVIIKKARLWFPHTAGEPFRYHCRVGYMYKNGDRLLDDFVDLRYGVRSADKYIDRRTSGHAFKINGRSIFLAGGNWIGTDQLLRYSADYDRYRSELLLHRAMGFNTIRVWGGGLAENEIFFDICDELGLLVMQDLWMTGDNNGRWAGNYSWPENHASYMANAESVFRRNRNRASLLMYAFGNELCGDSAAVSPPADISAALQTLLASLDADRLFIPSTMAPQSSEAGIYDPSYALAASDGPYGLLLSHKWYTDRNPGLSGYSDIPISFQPEVGSVSTPCLRSLKRMLGEEAADRFPSRGAQSGDVHALWAFHKYLPYTSKLADGSLYDHIYAYGTIESTKEFVAVAQAVQFDQYRALFEGYQLHQFEFYAGVLMWKSQSPWPALRGALYDYYLVQTGGFYGVQTALRGDLHVQMNPMTLVVSVINRDVYGKTEHQRSGKGVIIRVLVGDFHGAIIFERFLEVGGPLLAGQGVSTLASSPLHWPSGRDPNDVLLYRLVLLAADDGRVLSTNTYWLTDPAAAHPPDYSLIKNIRSSEGPSTVAASACYRDHSASGEVEVTVSLRNSGKLVAFMLRLAVLAADEEEIAPAMYSNNFLTLIRGETAEVLVRFPGPAPRRLAVEMEGLNVDRALFEAQECQ